jgi:hypothetical protein
MRGGTKKLRRGSQEIFFNISKYIVFFFEAEPKTGKRVVGEGTLVVSLPLSFSFPLSLSLARSGSWANNPLQAS